MFWVTAGLSFSSAAGGGHGAGVRVLSLVLSAREMFQVPLLSRKSVFILALFTKQLGWGALEVGSQVRGEITVKEGLSEAASSS